MAFDKFNGSDKTKLNSIFDKLKTKHADNEEIKDKDIEDWVEKDAQFYINNPNYEP